MFRVSSKSGQSNPHLINPCLYHLSWPWFFAKSYAQLHSASPNSCSNSYVSHWVKHPNTGQNNTTFLQQLDHFCHSNSMPSCSISTVGRFPGWGIDDLETVLERKVHSTDPLQPQRPIFPPRGSFTRTPNHTITMRQLPPVISLRKDHRASGQAPKWWCPDWLR